MGLMGTGQLFPLALRPAGGKALHLGRRLGGARVGCNVLRGLISHAPAKAADACISKNPRSCWGGDFLFPPAPSLKGAGGVSRKPRRLPGFFTVRKGAGV